MRYHHQFTVNVPLDQVRQFHSQSASMAAITPPPIIVQIHHAPAQLQSGDSMAFRMWFGPFPIRWEARIQNVTSTGFEDVQVLGPFKTWRHHHRFEALSPTQTAVIDEIQIELKSSLFWKLFGAGMALNLPILFAYRQWQTRRLLHKASTPEPS